MTQSPFHVLVVGAGLGGLCLAQGLKAAGVSVAVYERNAADVWPEGYRIHINPVGSRALHTCLPPALWDAFLAIAGKPPQGLGFLTEQLSELVVIGESFMSNADGSRVDAHHPVSRAALRHLLLSGMQHILHFNTSFERYEQTVDGKVTAYFADGTSATGDVLIAADGANSSVRRQYLPHAERIEIGTVGVAGKLVLTERTKRWLPRPLVSRMNLILSPSRYTIFTAPFDHREPSAATQNYILEKASAADLDPRRLIETNQNYMLWSLIAPAHAIPTNASSFDQETLQNMVRRIMTRWHPDLRRIIAETEPETLKFVPFKTSVPLAPWQSTNVTLLGDAIHNMPPVGGIGGNLALRDARLLVEKLTAVHRNDVELRAAIQAYEAEMQRYGFDAVRMVLDHTRQVSSTSRLVRAGGRTWFRLCNAVPPLKQVFESRWSRLMRS